MSNKEKLLVIVGPTAVGKTSLSIDLAKALDGEIISGDSMQVYKGMDIGTAKITEAEMDSVPHYLIDILEPDKDFSVADFQHQSRQLITEINLRGKLPMIVGGTGLYIQSVIYEYKFSEAQKDLSLRTALEEYTELHGKEALHQRLQAIDPITAKRLHQNDVKRVIRALEIYELTGKPMAEYQQRSSESPYQLCLLGLTMERTLLYERINMRVDLMISQGLVAEVQRLLDQGYDSSIPSLQGIGYKEVIDYLHGKTSLDEAIERIKKNSRNFAKRQLTWFRSMKDINWLDMTEPGDRAELVENIRSFVAGKIR
ncbi:tRNA (adenosine(37)-N6)-dimethylallyltransferase MiaA [Ammoniphilus sp. CFH 90114]|uniref:tRNA (adenosine(37)-N6)-dimethylallyltransferase MiaA n=1 Tax=Ammoniphilus sp. CFH 90114 TaxID=2493665 RepID=UPI00100F2126|nr:tRNA (adenosine(37)-N6)-dimethylallyltransferase MiaA [Ammoniphilus sp. CFH 90114]RXT15205.1 tRNA (adenosine(37)-N6)-dimethylallyltransferase MiaA [Ammoniphilus sp. CFH 90114]